MSQAKNNRKCYTEKEKKGFIDRFEEIKVTNPKLSARKFAESQNIPPATFAKWKKIENLDENSTGMKRRPNLYPTIEKALFKWFCQYKDAGGNISNDMLKVKYQHIYDTKNAGEDSDVTAYEVPKAMVDRFKVRYNLVNKRCFGEMRDADFEAAREFKWKDLHPDFSDWSAEKWENLVKQGRLYNSDETGLQYQQQSNTSICRKDEARDSLGRKLNKKRITFTLTVSCTGKILPLQVIHTAGVSRCMRRAGLKSAAIWQNRHNIIYHHNKKAWQTMVTFDDFIGKTAVTIAALHAGAGIGVMIIDNATSHTCNVFEVGNFKGSP